MISLTVFSTRTSSLRPNGSSAGTPPSPEIAVVYQRGPRRDRVGDHDPARLEPAIAGGDYRSEHPLVDPEPTEPLRDDHVDMSRELDVHDLAVDHVDDLRDPVRGGQLLRQDGDRRPLHRVHPPSAGLRREHARDPLPAPRSRTMSPGRTTELIARRKASVRTRSLIIVRCTSNSAYIGSGGFLIGVRMRVS